MTSTTGTATINVAAKTSQVATVLVNGSGSLVESSDLINIAAASGTATGMVTLMNGGCVKADTVNVFAGGTLGGTGCVMGDVAGLGGNLNPGNSPGTLDILGDLSMTGGFIDIELMGVMAGQYDLINVMGEVDLTDTVFRFIFGGDPAVFPGHVLDFFTFATLDMFSGVGFDLSLLPSGLLATILMDSDSFAISFATAEAPEPRTMILLLLGLLTMMALRRRGAVRG